MDLMLTYEAAVAATVLQLDDIRLIMALHGLMNLYSISGA